MTDLLGRQARLLEAFEQRGRNFGPAHAQDEAEAARIGIWGEAPPAEAEREVAGGQAEADTTDSAAP